MSHETKPEVKKFAFLTHEVGGNVVWDSIKFIWQHRHDIVLYGAAGTVAISTAASAFIQKLRGVPVDWFIIGLLALFSFISIFIGIILGRRKSTEVLLDKAGLTSTESPATQPALPPSERIVEKILPCPYEWAHSIIENQRTGIDRFIVITNCSIRTQDLSRPVPYIEFGFSIRNGSVYSIAIEDKKLEGHIEFHDSSQLKDDHELGGQLLMTDNGIKDCLYGNSGRFTIQQRLSREEAEMIAKATASPDASFMFDRLFVIVIGADPTKQVEPQFLRLRIGVTLEGNSFELYRR